MKPRIRYIELKSHRGGHDDNGPARIGRVTFSDTGKTRYYRSKAFRKHHCVCGNYRDVKTGEDYWISGPKTNGSKRGTFCFSDKAACPEWHEANVLSDRISRGTKHGDD